MSKARDACVNGALLAAWHGVKGPSEMPAAKEAHYCQYDSLS
jgi:hypothetical protein